MKIIFPGPLNSKRFTCSRVQTELGPVGPAAVLTQNLVLVLGQNLENNLSVLISL